MVTGRSAAPASCAIVSASSAAPTTSQCLTTAPRPRPRASTGWRKSSIASLSQSNRGYRVFYEHHMTVMQIDSQPAIVPAVDGARYTSTPLDQGITFTATTFVLHGELRSAIVSVSAGLYT